MLSELRVRNFAIIDDLHVRFHPGFNVLTGETGAGKSIIIDAIELLLGARSSQEMVRAGEDRASIEGIFELSGEIAENIQKRLEEEGLDGEEGLLILAREVRREGRSVARINGRAVSQALLAEIGGRLVDIHGQGQHLSLLRVREHLFLLDRFAGLESQRTRVAELVAALRTVRNELAVLQQNARDIARQIDLLSYQVGEIDAAGLQPGEDEALESERRRLANAETLATQSAAIYALLAEGNPELPSLQDQLGEAIALLARLVRVDPELQSLLEQLEGLGEGLDEVARALNQYGEQIAYDPERLAEVEERLDLIFQLKRKYGDTIEEILAYGEEARSKLELLAQSETRTEHLVAEEDRLLHELGREAAALSQARQQAAGRLAEAIEQELEDLRMGGTRFRVEIGQEPDPQGCFVGEERLAFDSTGIDRVEFLVSANPGEPLRPLVKVASGGETARMMLALKNVLSRADATPTLIFDEIDQGIGGRVGAIVGKKLYDLSASHQVLCVTHLPQIAAYGDHHLAVTKGVEGQRTVTRLQALEGQARIRELAAMAGSASETGWRSAQELLRDVAGYKGQPLENLTAS
ncbi:MAG: DNA repair protein RecN [Caldilineae bacterium]|nr:MAG: DNA repair protein RecN [Caldilineae bacterium]